MSIFSTQVSSFLLIKCSGQIVLLSIPDFIHNASTICAAVVVASVIALLLLITSIASYHCLVAIALLLLPSSRAGQIK